jgi:hypothetical protein
MEYTTDVNESIGICTIYVTGHLKRPDDSMVLQQLARNIDEEHDIQKFLIDMTNAEIIGEPIDALQAGIVPIDPSFKMSTHRTALVYSKRTADNTLMEDTLAKRGYNVRVLYNIDEANKWLMEKEE